MEVRASGRAALVIAAGLWMGLGLGLAASAQAAPASSGASSDKQVAAKPQPAKKPMKPAAAAKAEPVAAMPKPRPAKDKAAAAVAGAAAAVADKEAPLPDTVANANAWIPVATPAPTAADRAIAEGQLVASDQLNDLDLAATPAEFTPQPTVGQSTAVVAASAPHDDTLWRQTSLIGKIFIAFGGLLTVASAARMFIV